MARPKVIEIIWNAEVGNIQQIRGLENLNSTELMDLREELLSVLDKASEERRDLRLKAQ